jgi:hypothetical protein
MRMSIHMLTGKDVARHGIAGNTALVGSGEYYEVLHSGGVTVWSRAGTARVTRGSLPFAERVRSQLWGDQKYESVCYRFVRPTWQGSAGKH